MFSNFKVAFAVLVTAAICVNAQSSTASAPAGLPSGITACSLQCIQQSLGEGNCQSITDVQCLCSSQAFQAATLQCLQTNCPDDVSAATAAQQSQCGNAASSGSSSLASSASSISQSVASGSSASSVAASITSGASSAASSLSSRAAGGASSLSSSLSSVLSSASVAATNTGNGSGAVSLFSQGGIVSAVVALVGVVAGAAFVL
ncbi:unnamed protein product [Somion occarium]|uniref:CFEM domain-containing protein n=1 Tax=Somion occarium TaxID=3059160 RepID=A0ABP1DVF8_9APHY